MMLYVSRKVIDPLAPYFIRPIYVDPFEIKHSIEPSDFVRRGRYRLSGTVVSEDWDPVIEMPPKHRLLSMAFSARFLHQIDSTNEAIRAFAIREEDAHEFQRMFDEVQKERYSVLFEGIRKSGFRIASFGSTGVEPFHICIEENGDLLFTTGKHRLAIAKAIGFDTIPVRVAGRHTGWIRYRQAFHRRLAADCLSDLDRDRLAHPDLQDLIYRAA
ncbi:ParB N-terminal domain-containing protein [Wenzhouxiangella sp. EGI_FJ10305]|uniref:hypothetical protein n=1 Tax=Wenzhouxiangella sp. EGI_FJ10305 TaxID=3243768 RepID=UPI0035DB3F5C